MGAGTGSGKLRIHDPRGHSPPFAREFFHTPRSGDMVIFPSWVSHMLTVTSASADAETVVFTFHVRPAEGPFSSEDWWTDPVADMRFSGLAPVTKEMMRGVKTDVKR